MVDPGSGAALAGSIAKSYERGEAWFGYYWAPTGVLGKYEMVKVDFESGVDEEHYVNCISKEDTDKWTGWVSDEVAGKVKKALDSI